MEPTREGPRPPLCLVVVVVVVVVVIVVVVVVGFVAVDVVALPPVGLFWGRR